MLSTRAYMILFQEQGREGKMDFSSLPLAYPQPLHQAADAFDKRTNSVSTAVLYKTLLCILLYLSPQ